MRRHARVSTRVRGIASDGGGDGGEVPFTPSVSTATRGRERVSPRMPGPPGRREQAVPSQEQRPYDGQARRARPMGLHHTPPQVSGFGAPQEAQEWDAFLAAVRDSLDAFMSTLHERLSFFEADLGASRRPRRRRRRLSFSSSDEEYSGGDGGRHVPRSAVARALGRELEGNPHLRLPEKIILADDRYAGILHCVSYALANTDVGYDRTMAHGLGRLHKDVSATFSRDAEWDGTPAFCVFQFLNSFVNAGKDNDVSDGTALYLLLTFTEGDLKRELYTITLSLQGWRSGEVSSYMELVNWLLRNYADEQSLSDQEGVIHGASQRDVETENEFYVRYRGLLRLSPLWVYPHGGADEERLFSEARLGDSRRYAQTQHWQYADEPLGAICPEEGSRLSRRHEEQQAEEARRAEARRERRATQHTPLNYATAPVMVPTKVREVPSGPSPRGKDRFGKPRKYNYLACNMPGTFFHECPRLDPETKALLNKAYEERMADFSQEDQRRPKNALAAVGTRLGPSWSSSDKTLPPSVKAEELVEEDKSSSENE